MIDEKAFHAAWEAVGWDTQNPHAELGQRRFIAAYEANRSARTITPEDFGGLVAVATDASYWHDNPHGNGNGKPLHKYRAEAVVTAVLSRLSVKVEA
jgi:hypothetical protein